MVVKNPKVSFVESKTESTRGVKGGSGSYWKHGKHYSVNCGWARIYSPAKITVHFSIDGKSSKAEVEPFFARNWDCNASYTHMNPLLFAAIVSTAPDELNIEERTGPYGKKYYAVEDADLWAWLQDAKALVA